jgi:hypothetical protein
MVAAWVGWLLLLVGCWGSTSVPPPQDPIVQPVQNPPTTVRSHRRIEASRCVRAIDNALEKFRPELDKIPGMSAREPLLRDAALLSCESTAWTDEVTTCFETAVDVPALNGCRTKLTGTQIGDLNQRMSDVMSAPVP